MERACSVIDAVYSLLKHVLRMILIQVKDVIGLEGKGNLSQGLSDRAEELLVGWFTRFFEGLLTSHRLLLFAEFIHNFSFDLVVGNGPKGKTWMVFGDHLE